MAGGKRKCCELSQQPEVGNPLPDGSGAGPTPHRAWSITAACRDWLAGGDETIDILEALRFPLPLTAQARLSSSSVMSIESVESCVARFGRGWLGPVVV